MSRHPMPAWQHEHPYHPDSDQHETRTRWVMWLSAVTMVAEIAAGWWYQSMALLADGWHMATHIAAFAIAVFAYRHARRHAGQQRYTFGTGKVGVLGGFASAIVLGVVALLMVIEALQRIAQPGRIAFDQALVVASIGLLVNLISAVLLHHDHDDEHGGHDHALHASYVHVLADALTSVLAIAALLIAKYSGWLWLDPAIALVAALIITRWSYALLQQTAPILLDASAEQACCDAIVHAIEADADNRISDLHVWRVSTRHYAAIIAIVTDTPQTAAHYKHLLRHLPQLSHITIEVQHCRMCR